MAANSSSTKPLKSLEELTSHFKSTPWCAKIFSAPGIIPFPPPSRRDPNQLPAGSTPSQDQLFGRSLDDESAVPQFMGFYQDPFAAATDSSSDIAITHPDLPFLTKSASLIFNLRPGVNGFNATVHGGFIAAMIDEAMGALLFQNDVINREAKAKGLLPQTAKDFADLGYFTARMDVRLRRPIPTPSIVVVAASLDKVEGRKIFLSVVVKGETDEAYATCEGMWMSISKRKL